MKFLIRWLVVLILVLLASCGEATQTLVSSSTSTPTIIAAPTATPTKLPIPTGTNSTQPTSAVLATALPSPTVSPVPTTQLLPVPSPLAASVREAAPTLVVTNSAGRHISFIDPTVGVLDRIEVGVSPWGLALASGNKVYVATAEGVAVVDTKNRKRIALVPYRAKVGQPQFGEYRPGGMGIAASPDGKFVYVGVYLTNQPSQLEVLDTEKLSIISSVPVGIRPFQVLVSRDGKQVYSIDHDSYSVTVVDAAKFTSRTLNIAALGRGSFDKAHYAAQLPNGHLLLPIQGRVLVDLDLVGGNFTTAPLSASTHQHGVTLTPDGKKLLIVGTGPAGGVSGKPGLTIRDLSAGTEEFIPLTRPHETVTVSPDAKWAYVTGGHTFANEGWDGLSLVNLQTRAVSELPVPDRPLDIVILPTS